MQTFLPYPDFTESAQVLDRQRLGKQRVEAHQILNTLLGLSEGWRNHPAVRMWRGFEVALISYGEAMCREWIARHYKDTTLIDLQMKRWLYLKAQPLILPSWLGGPIHASHRSRLLEKLPSHYSQFGWTELPGLSYHWPEP